VSLQELYDAFADGWEVESVQPVLGEVNPAFTAEFPDAYPEGSKMWFAVIRRATSQHSAAEISPTGGR
jgi:hypothetical protein